MHDPTREEMLAELARALPSADEWTTEPAIYWFAHDYHGGQSTSLYEALYASPYQPSKLEYECPEDAKEAYDALVEAYVLRWMSGGKPRRRRLPSRRWY